MHALSSNPTANTIIDASESSTPFPWNEKTFPVPNHIQIYHTVPAYGYDPVNEKGD